jgi:hypothetical protein
VLQGADRNTQHAQLDEQRLRGERSHQLETAFQFAVAGAFHLRVAAFHLAVVSQSVRSRR